MAIVQFFNSENLPEYMRCAICGKHILPAEATAGLRDTDNQQQFSCNGHFWSPHQLITGWADFMADERVKQVQSQFTADYRGTSNARLMH